MLLGDSHQNHLLLKFCGFLFRSTKDKLPRRLSNPKASNSRKNGRKTEAHSQSEPKIGHGNLMQQLVYMCCIYKRDLVGSICVCGLFSPVEVLTYLETDFLRIFGQATQLAVCLLKVELDTQKKRRKHLIDYDLQLRVVSRCIFVFGQFLSPVSRGRTQKRKWNTFLLKKLKSVNCREWWGQVRITTWEFPTPCKSLLQMESCWRYLSSSNVHG